METLDFQVISLNWIWMDSLGLWSEMFLTLYNLQFHPSIRERLEIIHWIFPWLSEEMYKQKAH